MSPRDLLLAALPDAARARFAALDLDARLTGLAASTSDALGFAVSAAQIAEAMGPRLDPEAKDAEAELSALAVEDLALAAACARGEDAALRAFDRRHGEDLDLAIAKSPNLRTSKEEFRQLFRDRMFVAEPGAPPRIAGYAGRGSLRAWVRVTATRMVIDLSRAKKQPEPVSDDALASLLPATADPEITYLRDAYASLLPAAFDDALAKLTPRQRNLLRQRYLHGLSGDKLAGMYGVHRGTMFGWIEDARRSLLGHVRSAMHARVPAHQLDSIVALLGSRLDLSVGRMLVHDLEPER